MKSARKTRQISTTIQVRPTVSTVDKPTIAPVRKNIVKVRFVGGLKSEFIRVLNAQTGTVVQMNLNGDSVPLYRKEVERLRKIGFILDELEGA